MADKTKKILSECQKRAMFASIRNRHKIEALELELEYLYGTDFLEDDEEDENDWEERYDENGDCYLCKKSEDDCFCFEPIPSEFRDFVPYDD